MNKDTLMDIAIHLNVTDLEHLCQTNQAFLDICSNPHFWTRKYIENHLPLTVMNPTTINEWIKDYVATKKTMDLLWLNHQESQLLNSEVGIQLIFSDLTEKELNDIPFPSQTHLEISKWIENFSEEIKNSTQILMQMDSEGKDIYIQIDVHGGEWAENVYNVGKDFVFTMIKNFFLYNKDKYLSDYHGISYGSDLQKDMLNVDCYYLEHYPKRISLRKQLLNDYQIDFDLKKMMINILNKMVTI